MTPLGVANDRVRQVGGRYTDATNFDFMMNMGVWTENLSLPAVLNECLMQSYDGKIRLFPNTIRLGRTAFRDLRAAGALLVSAVWDGKAVGGVRITSEKGAVARIVNPWAAGKAEARIFKSGLPVRLTEREGILEFATTPGESYILAPRSGA